MRIRNSIVVTYCWHCQLLHSNSTWLQLVPTIYKSKVHRITLFLKGEKIETSSFTACSALNPDILCFKSSISWLGSCFVAENIRTIVIISTSCLQSICSNGDDKVACACAGFEGSESWSRVSLIRHQLPILYGTWQYIWLTFGTNLISCIADPWIF